MPTQLRKVYMRKNNIYVLALCAFIFIVVLAFKFIRFTYISLPYPNPEIKREANKVHITFETTRPYISGIIIYTEKSYYTKGSQYTEIPLSVIYKNEDMEKVKHDKTTLLSEYPYHNFKKIQFKEPLYNPKLGKVTFTFDLVNALSIDGKFYIGKSDASETYKNTEPRILYSDSIGDITRDARALFYKDRPFYNFYLAIHLFLFASSGLLLTVKKNKSKK